MNSINLRQLVSQAIQSEWSTFAQAHPRLSVALDQQLLIDQVVEDLSDDPDFHKALQQAAVADATLQGLDEFFAQRVKDWLRGLL